MTSENAHEKYIRQCFELALTAEGRTSPNPIVGAVVVSDDGTILGTGYHPKQGEPHAEVFALDEAGEKARGATIYVSLEPCSHQGRTPPCTDRVIASGVKRVVAAMTDPNPKVAGSGFEKLRTAGIEVVTPVLEEEARWTNRAFLKAISTGTPWVVLKIATTLDGKIADRTGTSKWITGPEARQHVHELRNRLDCVLIGATTARLDNPELNVRELGSSARHPKRAVLDPNLTVDTGSRLFDPNTGGDTIVYCGEECTIKKDYPSGVHIALVPGKPLDTGDKGMRLNLGHVLKDLKERGVSSVLCEGGGTLAGSLLEEDLVDEIHWFVAPAILGDTDAIASVSIKRPVPLSTMKRFRHLKSTTLGGDTLIHLIRPALPWLK